MEQAFFVLFVCFVHCSISCTEVHRTRLIKLYWVTQRQYSHMVRCAGFGGSKLSNYGPAIYWLYDLGQDS